MAAARGEFTTLLRIASEEETRLLGTTSTLYTLAIEDEVSKLYQRQAERPDT